MRGIAARKVFTSCSQLLNVFRMLCTLPGLIARRAYVLTTGREIKSPALPFEILISESASYPQRELPTLDEVKRKIITQTLEFTKGRKLAAAEILGIERRSLNRLIKKLNIPMSQIKEEADD